MIYTLFAPHFHNHLIINESYFLYWEVTTQAPTLRSPINYLK